MYAILRWIYLAILLRMFHVQNKNVRGSVLHLPDLIGNKSRQSKVRCMTQLRYWLTRQRFK